MENIQLLLIIGMIVFSIFRFLNKKKTETSLPTALEGEEYIEPQADKEIFSYFEEVEKKATKNLGNNKLRKDKVKENRSEKQPIPSYHESQPTKNSTHSISLNKRSEAKRAFIYSEILKRKY